jgi:hypothetical protein
MDVIEMLKQDHERVRTLFQQFRGGGGLTGLVKRVTGTVSARERRTTAEKICRELEIHTRLEEELFYPAVRALDDPKLREMVDESLREHAQIKEQVAGLRAEPKNEELDVHVTGIEQWVQHHVAEEEKEMFPRVEELMPEERRAEIASRMQARKRSRGAAPKAAKKAAAAKRARKPAARATRGRARAARTKAAAPRKAKQAKRARGGRSR